MDFIFIIIGVVYVIYKLIADTGFFEKLSMPDLSPEEQESFNRQESLNRLSKEKIGDLIGLPYESLPDNHKLVFDSGVCASKCMSDSSQKRRCATLYILNKEGINWYCFYSIGYGKYCGTKNTNVDEEYKKEFDKFVEEKLQLKSTIQNRMCDAGYSLDESLIDKVALDKYSPVNYEYVGVDAKTIFEWLCLSESDNIKYCNDDKLGALLGVPLNLLEIPDGGMEKRRMCAKIKILSSKNLKYVPDMFDTPVDEKDEYLVYFNNFVDNYLQ